MEDYTQYPRLAQLLDIALRSTRDSAKVWGSEVSAKVPKKADVLRRIEALLEQVDDDGWRVVLSKARKFAEPDTVRGWQQAFDAVNEVAAYAYLKERFGSIPRFIPEAKDRRPDLEIVHTDGTVICECKTINPSNEEVAARRAHTARHTEAHLSQKFLTTKLHGTINVAIEQIRSYRSDASTVCIVYIVINFDDLLHEYEDNYMAEIDSYIQSVENWKSFEFVVRSGRI